MNLEPVSVTKKALVEIVNIMNNKGIPENYSLRIGIKGGGCGAMGHVLGFDQATETDITYQCEEVRVIIEKKHVMYLMGLEVDFYEDAESRGFLFNKPKET